MVVIKKSGVRTQPFVGNAVGGRLVYKTKVFLVDKQLVRAVVARHIARVAHINIQPAVGIYVRQRSARAPLFGASYACFFANVFKLKISFVQKQLVVAHVRGQKHVYQPVVVYIAQGYAAAVVKISVGKHIKFTVVAKFVFKINARVVRRHFGKQGRNFWGRRFAAT